MINSSNLVPPAFIAKKLSDDTLPLEIAHRKAELQERQKTYRSPWKLHTLNLSPCSYLCKECTLHKSLLNSMSHLSDGLRGPPAFQNALMPSQRPISPRTFASTTRSAVTLWDLFTMRELKCTTGFSQVWCFIKVTWYFKVHNHVCSSNDVSFHLTTNSFVLPICLSGFWSSLWKNWQSNSESLGMTWMISKGSSGS